MLSFPHVHTQTNTRAKTKAIASKNSTIFACVCYAEWQHQIKKRWAKILIRKHYFKSIFLVYISHLSLSRSVFLSDSIHWINVTIHTALWWWIQSKAQVIKHNQVEMSSDLHANDNIFFETNRPYFSLVLTFSGSPFRRIYLYLCLWWFFYFLFFGCVYCVRIFFFLRLWYIFLLQMLENVMAIEKEEKKKSERTLNNCQSCVCRKFS